MSSGSREMRRSGVLEQGRAISGPVALCFLSSTRTPNPLVVQPFGVLSWWRSAFPCPGIAVVAFARPLGLDATWRRGDLRSSDLPQGVGTPWPATLASRRPVLGTGWVSAAHWPTRGHFGAACPISRATRNTNAEPPVGSAVRAWSTCVGRPAGASARSTCSTRLPWLASPGLGGFWSAEARLRPCAASSPGI